MQKLLKRAAQTALLGERSRRNCWRHVPRALKVGPRRAAQAARSGRATTGAAQPQFREAMPAPIAAIFVEGRQSFRCKLIDELPANLVQRELPASIDAEGHARVGADEP